MSKSHFQVIIVGGSIGGLTLAHCLRSAGIDHIVLEKSSSPAPQIGASIGILPNGARILDQLQLWSEVEDCIEPLNTATIGLPDGFSFSSSYPQIINERFVCFNIYCSSKSWASLTLFAESQRFGFPIAFLDRQKLLEILYRRYPHPSTIRLKEKVTAIETSDSGATVTTANGSVYQGALVVGADGVHSIVRQEIWRASEKLSSATMVAQEKSCLTAEFRCIFGISSAIKGLNVGEQVNALFDGLTIVTIHGKNGRVYWFVIQKLDKKYTYPNCPRYTKSDTAVAAEELRNIKFYQDITFGRVWENRETASMTVLEENTFKTWYHGRLVLIGDSVHKMTPNVGQGANMAIEDAAALTNLLHNLRKFPGTLSSTTAQIGTVLRQYRSIRYERVESIYRDSRFLVRFQARDGLLNILLSRYYAPYAGDLPADMASKTIADGVMCDFLPPPKRSGDGWKRYRRNGRLRGRGLQAILYIFMLAILYTWIGRENLGSMVFSGCGSLFGFRNCRHLLRLF